MGKMDLWYGFACYGIDLLKTYGVLCFIATNNWVTSFGANILRNKVIKETRICNLVDFGAIMMFESASIQTLHQSHYQDLQPCGRWRRINHISGGTAMNKNSYCLPLIVPARIKEDIGRLLKTRKNNHYAV